MRVSAVSKSLRVSAVSGTHVILFGFDLPEARCTDLAGFAIHRTDLRTGRADFLRASKVFRETDPGVAAAHRVSTREHPVQSFQWSDYTAQKGVPYRYAVSALVGLPTALRELATTTVELTTETPEGGDHDIYFNRGVAASQEYSRRFGDRRPEDVPNRAAFTWLSRGLYEAMEEYVRSCEPGKHALRICAYEFRYPPFLELIAASVARGVEVEIIYDARKDPPSEGNRLEVKAAGLKRQSLERRTNSAISHNKFMVKLLRGKPVEVWTGGTNFSEGGIFGHSNVAHVVQDKEVAAAFLDYWTLLRADPDFSSLRPAVEALSALPEGLPPPGTTVVFSPRETLDALDWYASLATGAREGLFMTFAFGMEERFQTAFRESTAPCRFALLEKATRPMKPGPERVAEEKKIAKLRALTENTFAIGSELPRKGIDGWLAERLSELNRNVKHVHNKFMLVDPLSADPIVIAGSANFSVASTTKNDENMLVVRGNTRVADIYLGEFMRLYTHHAFREAVARSDGTWEPKFLRTDDWWRDHFGNTSRSARRTFFARTFSA